jgi:hypothetical protein
MKGEIYWACDDGVELLFSYHIWWHVSCRWSHNIKFYWATAHGVEFLFSYYIWWHAWGVSYISPWVIWCNACTKFTIICHDKCFYITLFIWKIFLLTLCFVWRGYITSSWLPTWLHKLYHDIIIYSMII